jgi:hypothetical protein
MSFSKYMTGIIQVLGLYRYDSGERQSAYL